MGDLHTKECFAFLDDCNVPGKDFAEEMERLEHVFEKLRQHQLKLNIGKCQLFKTRVKYCGHVIFKEGIETDSEKIEKITQWPVPQTAAQVREFLRFAWYDRRFLKNFSQLAKPLNELLGGTPKKKTGERETGRESNMTTLKASEWKGERINRRRLRR